MPSPVSNVLNEEDILAKTFLMSANSDKVSVSLARFKLAFVRSSLMITRSVVIMSIPKTLFWGKTVTEV